MYGIGLYVGLNAGLDCGNGHVGVGHMHVTLFVSLIRTVITSAVRTMDSASCSEQKVHVRTGLRRCMVVSSITLLYILLNYKI